MIVRLIKATVGNLEYDARTQYKFHLVATWFWLITMLLIPFVIHPHSSTEWVSLVILEVSLYANFATEFGAMSAAIAAEQEQPAKQPLPPFSNPNYKPPMPGSLGLGWDDQDNAGMEDAGIANF